MRSGDTQSSTANPSIYVEIQTPSPEEVSSRIVSFHFDEQIFGGVYEIWLDNADSSLAGKSYEGYKVDFRIGFVSGSQSQYHDLWIDKQNMESVEGKLLLKLTCIDAWGLLARVNTTVGAQYWNYPELAPGEPDADADHYDKTIKQIFTSVLQDALDVSFTIDDDDSETYFNSLKPPMSITNARTGLFQAIMLTEAYPLIKNDNHVHIIKPSDHASVYTFNMTSNYFWEESAQNAVVVPNRVVFHGRTAAGVDLDSGNNGLDTTSYGRIGIYIDEHYYATRSEVELISDQTLLDNLAAATIAKYQGEASLGTLFAPMHCSLELLDKITVTDTRYSGTKTITGYVHRIVRDYQANKGVYSISVQLGGVATGYTPEHGAVPQKLTNVEPPQPISGNPFTLAPAFLPIVLDITFTAVDHENVSWSSGTIKTASGKVFSINSGNLLLSNSNPYYLYYDTVADDGGLDNTQTFTDTTSHERLLVAFLKKAPSGVQKAMIVPAKGGHSPLLNEDNLSANCITANEIYVASLSAISADMGLLTAGEIRVGTGTLGSNFTGWRMWVESGAGRIGGYNNNILQWYSDTDGKLYAGGGNVIIDTDGIKLKGDTLRFLNSGGTMMAYMQYNSGGYWDITAGDDIYIHPWNSGDRVSIARLKTTQTDVSGSRSLGTVYQASHFPLIVQVSLICSATGDALVYVEEGDSTPDLVVAEFYPLVNGAIGTITFEVPPYAYYKVVQNVATVIINTWYETTIGA